MDYIINLGSQLREYLRALRKERGLTQAELGRLIGVGQARMAEIEGNPAAVSVDQLMAVLGALHATLAIKATRAAPDRKKLREASTKTQASPDLSPNLLNRSKKGSW